MVEISEQNLANFLKKVENEGVYNRNTKKMEKLSPVTLQDYKNTIKNFIEKVKIKG